MAVHLDHAADRLSESREINVAPFTPMQAMNDLATAGYLKIVPVGFDKSGKP